MDKTDGCAPDLEPNGRRLFGGWPPWRLVLSLLLLVTSVMVILLLLINSRLHVQADTLTEIRERGVLRYGSDAEGGGPFIFADPNNPSGEPIGFEPELMTKLCGGLGPKPTYTFGPWDTLLQSLGTRHVDVVVNGYELTEVRKRDYLATRPYYIYQLQLMAPKSGMIRSWDDVKQPPASGGKWKVGVLGGSGGDIFAKAEAEPHVEIVRYQGATDAMKATVIGHIDATLQDLPASRFYLPRPEYESLEPAGPPVGKGYYVMYCRKNDTKLVQALDAAIGEMLANGDLKRIYEKYSIWTDLQEDLANVDVKPAPSDGANVGLALIWQYRQPLVEAAWMTFRLSVTSMPLAMAIGLMVALGRLYGPSWVAFLLGGYIEFLRGTPLMLQLYVLYFVLELPAEVAAITGLAINYSAYEAEIYRAGLQAIPAGQMEAALALGMSKRMALQRIIVPQAVRIVIPAVTNDFIALFKDTSVCSVVAMVELTKSFSIQANGTGRFVEFAIVTAMIYLFMSVPLSAFSRWSERKLGSEGEALKGGLV